MEKPRVTAEELAALLSSHSEPVPTEAEPSQATSAGAAPRVHMSIELAHGLVEPDGLISLHPGDIIHLGQSPAQPVNILIDDVFVARGRVLNIDGELCVEVLGFATDGDETVPS